MKIFGFGTHRIKRDGFPHHLVSVVACVDEARRQIDRDLSTQRECYDRRCCDAAFALDAMENDPSTTLSARLDALTAALAAEHDALAELSRQAHLVAQLQTLIADDVRSGEARAT